MIGNTGLFVSLGLITSLSAASLGIFLTLSIDLSNISSVYPLSSNWILSSESLWSLFNGSEQTLIILSPRDLGIDLVVCFG